jgi:hypothetical protein
MFGVSRVKEMSRSEGDGIDKHSRGQECAPAALTERKKRARRRTVRKRAGGRVISGVLLGASGVPGSRAWSTSSSTDASSTDSGAKLLADFGASARRTISPNGNLAASDDASGSSDAPAAPSAAACADREACADAAGIPGGELRAAAKLGLPADAGAFAEEMSRRVDLYAVGQRLLLSDDEKVAQRALERVLEMRYGKGAAAATEDAPQVQIDLPRPVRG